MGIIYNSRNSKDLIVWICAAKDDENIYNSRNSKDLIVKHNYYGRYKIYNSRNSKDLIVNNIRKQIEVTSTTVEIQKT